MLKMEDLPKAFEQLKKFHQFIVYKLVPSASHQGKNTKLPINHKTGNTIKLNIFL
jgi:primase-polymerase (primpol)-like protein